MQSFKYIFLTINLLISALVVKAQWHYIFNDSSISFQYGGISVLNADTAFFIGSQINKNYTAIILRTTDGGTIFDSTFINVGNNLYASFLSIYFASIDTGYAVIDYEDTSSLSLVSNTILKTTDGGDSWQDISTHFIYGVKQFEKIYFKDNLHGYMGAGNLVYNFNHIANSGTWYKTDDGGLSWSLDSAISGAVSVYFKGDTGVAASNLTFSYYTTDNGNIWNSLSLNSFSNYKDAIIKNGKIYVGGGGAEDGNGNGVIAYSSDLGNTWSYQILYGVQCVYNITTTENNKIYFSGFEGIYNVGFLDYYSGNAKYQKLITPNGVSNGLSWYTLWRPMLRGIQFANDSVGYALANSNHQIYKTTNGGGSGIGLSIADIGKLSGVEIYPNPFQDGIIIETKDNGKHTATLYDIAGKLILSKAFRQQRFLFDTGKLPKGVYILKVKGKKTEQVFKMIH